MESWQLIIFISLGLHAAGTVNCNRKWQHQWIWLLHQPHFFKLLILITWHSRVNPQNQDRVFQRIVTKVTGKNPPSIAQWEMGKLNQPLTTKEPHSQAAEEPQPSPLCQRTCQLKEPNDHWQPLKLTDHLGEPNSFQITKKTYLFSITHITKELLPYIDTWVCRLNTGVAFFSWLHKLCIYRALQKKYVVSAIQ